MSDDILRVLTTTRGDRLIAELVRRGDKVPEGVSKSGVWTHDYEIVLFYGAAGAFMVGGIYPAMTIQSSIEAGSNAYPSFVAGLGSATTRSELDAPSLARLGRWLDLFTAPIPIEVKKILRPRNPVVGEID